tara:strand:+ start:7139 stop:7768 length:630 start_codon:yes stop_codon:yes gene_type:complete
MDIILTKDVPGLGFKDEIVKVKNGYGRNYIIPKGYGILSNDTNKKILEENLKQTTKKQEELLKNANDLAKKIGDLSLEIKMKSGEEDKLFGSVTTTQISKLLSEKGYEIDKRNISINNKINSVGEYDISLKIHKDVTHDIKVIISGSVKPTKGKKSKKILANDKSKSDKKELNNSEDKSPETQELKDVESPKKKEKAKKTKKETSSKKK